MCNVLKLKKINSTFYAKSGQLNIKIKLNQSDFHKVLDLLSYHFYKKLF